MRGRRPTVGHAAAGGATDGSLLDLGADEVDDQVEVVSPSHDAAAEKGDGPLIQLRQHHDGPGGGAQRPHQTDAFGGMHHRYGSLRVDADSQSGLVPGHLVEDEYDPGFGVRSLRASPVLGIFPVPAETVGVNFNGVLQPRGGLGDDLFPAAEVARFLGGRCRWRRTRTRARRGARRRRCRW